MQLFHSFPIIIHYSFAIDTSIYTNVRNYFDSIDDFYNHETTNTDYRGAFPENFKIGAITNNYQVEGERSHARHSWIHVLLLKGFSPIIRIAY